MEQSINHPLRYQSPTSLTHNHRPTTSDKAVEEQANHILINYALSTVKFDMHLVKSSIQSSTSTSRHCWTGRLTCGHKSRKLLPIGRCVSVCQSPTKCSHL